MTATMSIRRVCRGWYVMIELLLFNNLVFPLEYPIQLESWRWINFGIELHSYENCNFLKMLHLCLYACRDS